MSKMLQRNRAVAVCVGGVLAVALLVAALTARPELGGEPSDTAQQEPTQTVQSEQPEQSGAVSYTHLTLPTKA